MLLIDSANAIADELGCSNVQPGEKIGPDESVDCEFAGDSINIGWFGSDESRDAYVKIVEQARQMGGVSPIVLGSNWSVECATEISACEEVRSNIGGELLE